MENKMLYIGLDVSMNSTGICFIYNGLHYYINILNRNILSKNKKLSNEDIIDNNAVLVELKKIENFKLVMIDRTAVPAVKTIGLSEWNRRNLFNAELCSDTIMIEMSKVIKSLGVDNKNIIVNIENYSYSSQTNNIIQIVELTHAIKSKLISVLNIPSSNMFLITAPEVKMELGNGNYDKYDMLEAFIDNRLRDDFSNDKFQNLMCAKKRIFHKSVNKKDKKNQEVITPISDIIDSYFIASWISRKYEA
jgi:hypothetical protein